MLFIKNFFINIILFKPNLIYILLNLIDFAEKKYLQSFVIILTTLIIFIIISKNVIN